MIKQLRLFSTLLLLAVASMAWGEEETVTFSEQGYSNGQAVTYYQKTDGLIRIDFGSGSTATAYYNTGEGVRIYGGGSMTVKPVNESYKITKIVITFSGNYKPSSGDDVVDCGLYDYDNGVWTGKESSVKFTRPTGSGHWRVQKLVVTLEAGSTTDPTIEAPNVDIAYNASSGSIKYTINNPTSENLGASTSSDWLTLGTVSENAVPFTCSENDAKTARTATVTLTYGAVTKNVTVTQAGNPNILDNISDITEAGTYNVQGTIVAKSQRGFIVGDGTGYAYYYNQNYTQDNYNIGDKVKLSGSVVAYGGVFEFNSGTTVTAATESNYVAEDPTVLTGAQMDELVVSQTTALSYYVQYEGTLSVNETHYNITNIDGATTAVGSISYPLSTDFTALAGKTVKVTGYFVGISSKKYFNTMLGNIEEVVDAAPVIDASDVTIEYNATSGEIKYKVNNAVEGKTLTATTTADWISEITVGTESVTFTTTPNEGTENRIATITLTYEGAEPKIVTVTQKYFVADFAQLPFEFDGGQADIETTAGLTHVGIDGKDYDNSPKLKFNTTGDELILHFNERPGVLTFDVKGNTFSGGTFTIQTSEDGVTYTDLESYTELGATQSEEFDNLDENVRYIKWIYTEKSSGNVALGNIVLKKYETPKIDPELSFAETAFTVEPGADFTAPALTNPYNVTVAYSSSDAEIAAVVEATGDVTIGEKEGTATITATFAGDDTYKAAEASYTITVKKPVMPGTDKYELVTDAATLKAGDELLIAYVDADGATVMSTEQKTNNRGAVEATVNADGTVTPNSDAQVVTLEGETNAWYFNVGDGYLYAAGNDKNYLKTEVEADDNAKAKITIAKDETTEAVEATIQFQGSNTRNLMRFNPNNGSPIFACYSSTSGTGSLPQLYRKVAESENKKGDVNNDGSVTIADVTTLVNIILGKNDNYNSEVADVNEDGSITIADVTTLVNIILGRAN